MQRRTLVFAAIALAAVLGMVGASVFVYYPASISLTYQAPPVVLEQGSNAGQPDLNGNTITVQIGANKTSARITLHPTFQKTWYYDLLRVSNTDANNAYYVKVRLSGNLDVSGSAYVLVYNSTGSLQANVSLGGTSNWIPLNANDYLRIDVVTVIDEGQAITGKTGVLTVDVIYSTQNTENPPG